MINHRGAGHLLVPAARLGAASSLAALGLLHAAWALGSSWPAPSQQALADAVVGAQAAPARLPTAVVAVGLLTSAAVVSGAVGGTRLGRGAAAALSAAFVARAALGGQGAARMITSAAPSPRFQALDRRLYRPLCAAIGAALLVSTAGEG